MDAALARGNLTSRDACPWSATIEFGVSNSKTETPMFQLKRDSQCYFTNL
jgi:hypothetical protein